MSHFNLTPTSPMSVKQENHTMDNGTLDSSTCSWHFVIDIKLAVIFSFICVACILGLLGNGTVIWLLGFRMKRNPVTTYILNLAVADFAVLIFVILSAAFILIATDCKNICIILLAGWMLFHVMFSISQCLLTIISIDRCVSVLFPIWYRCHRPKKLSTILCALIWTFCFLLYGTFYPLDVLGVFRGTPVTFYILLVVAVLCLPLITISSLMLFIKFCFKTQQRQRKKLLMAILLALFFFLFLAFPLNVIYLINRFLPSTYDDDDDNDIELQRLGVGYFCASLNSCVNPLIYFLVGRKKKGLCAENLKLILQRVFKQEEEVCGEELQLSVRTQVPA